MGRKKLIHEPPRGAGSGTIFFVTVCSRPAGRNQLCRDPVAAGVLESARYRHDIGDWWIGIMLLMPDHLHMLASFPGERTMNEVVNHWKRYTARQFGIRWQRDFFDHRIRNHESAEEKLEYIRMNPVRAGLVDRPEDWPYVITNDW